VQIVFRTAGIATKQFARLFSRTWRQSERRDRAQRRSRQKRQYDRCRGTTIIRHCDALLLPATVL
jgi:hypothetical protein